jgi:Leucine-rich repeat (LRR) protein
MRHRLLVVLGLFLVIELNGQMLIFNNKKDSIEYARLDALLAPRIEKGMALQDFGMVDSAFRARTKFLEGKQFVYRTIFRQDRNFTPYQDLYKIANKDSITKISVLGKGRRKLPDSLYRYRNLEDLELIDFKLRRLPKKLHVKRLILYNNFPSKRLKLSKNSTITTLTIRGDEKGMLPKRYDKLRDLQWLTLSRNNLKEVPDLEGCKNLKTLNVNNNFIGRIPPGIGKLTKLENLSLYKNNLSEIPAHLYTMTSLRVIDLYFNRIKTISPAIANWKNLEILYLANNEIYSIPNEIGELTNLRELYLHHNKISNLPASIGNITSLSVLRINNNGMIEWPAGLVNLKALTNFDCSFNQFETLPIADLDFRNMKILSIGGNPWDPKIRENIVAWVTALRENETVVHLDNNLSRD